MTSRLVQMQARIQQKQMEQKEEKMLRLYEDQQQRAFKRVGRGSAGSNNNNLGPIGGGKVRQMFDERRQKAGIDKSYPLEPLKGGSRNGSRVSSVEGITRTTITNTTTTRNNNKNNSNGTNLKNNGKRVVVQTTNKELDIVQMLNNNRICDEVEGRLEDEDSPDFGFIEMVGKLDNVGSKVQSKGPKVPKVNNTPNPIARRTVSKSGTTTTTTNNSNSSNSRNSPIVSKAEAPIVRTSMSKKPGGGEPRVPSASKPSIKQTSRSAVVRDDLDECKYCGRRFATDRLNVHESICAKTGKKKRKTYDATKHRLQGTELEPFSAPKQKPSAKAKQAPKKDWRRTHEEFIAAIRSAKMAQAHVAKGGKISDLPPPPPSSNPDYVQCPHCGRRFNESAAERHIPKCASYQFNKSKNGPPRKK